jgi:hypothetical protein
MGTRRKQRPTLENFETQPRPAKLRGLPAAARILLAECPFRENIRGHAELKERP